MTETTDSEFDAHYDAMLPFLKEFEGESDRASIVLGAARLDLALEGLLGRALLPPASGSDDSLLGVERPLGTFSARIEACYRLGLIDRPFRDALDLVRRMRNDCAHKLAGCNLSEGSQAERARQLVSRHMISEDFKAFHDASTYRFPEGLPGDFRIAVAGMMLRLETQAKDVRSLAMTGITLLP